jgi:TRAP-type C4-dicarboxylate transport system permease small subunit
MNTLYCVYVYFFSGIVAYVTLLRVFRFIFQRMLNMSSDSGPVSLLTKLNEINSKVYNDLLIPFDKNVLDKGFRGFLVVSVFIMMFLIIFPIILRKVAPDYYSHFAWSLTFVNHLVFLCVFIAGALATGSESNICIDILSKVLENKQMFEILDKVKRVNNYVCLAGVLWLTKSGLDFFIPFMDDKKILFLGIKESYMYAIMPIGFALLAYKFLLLILKSYFSKPEKA